MKTNKLTKVGVILAALWMPVAIGCSSDEADEWSIFNDGLEAEVDEGASIRVLPAADIDTSIPWALDYVSEKTENIACVYSNDIIEDYNNHLVDNLFSVWEENAKKNGIPFNFVKDSIGLEYVERYTLPKIDNRKETLVMMRLTVSSIEGDDFLPEPDGVVIGRKNGKNYLRMKCYYEDGIILPAARYFTPTDIIVRFIVNRPYLKPSDIVADVTIMSGEDYPELGYDRNMVTATSRKYERIPVDGWELCK